MTGPRHEHAEFDELAAGYALDALEPDEELRFRRHAGQCGRCSAALAGYAEVAAALGGTAPAAEPSSQLKARILAAAASPPPARQAADLPARSADSADSGGARRDSRPPAPAVPLHSRPRTRRLKIAAAAAAVVIAGGGAWGTLAASGSHSAPPAAGCAAARQCSEVVLTDAAGDQVAARVIVAAGTVWLQPAGLPADDTARQVYVLWQLTGKHTPLAVGSFDVGRGAQAPIRIGALAAPYHDTWAFAVSLERGRTIPASPSRPVALGQVSA